MPPPSPLTISTSAITRLLHEQKSYSTELATQEARVRKLELELQKKTSEEREGGEDEGGNEAFRLGQEADSGHGKWDEEVRRAREAIRRAKGE
ncbi:hypothetical protein MMC12_005449 [Toensbergia leucococca]|nr:hypothetical protein [Toensbergia leucococca]